MSKFTSLRGESNKNNNHTSNTRYYKFNLLKFLKLAFLFLGAQVKLAHVKVAKESIVISGTNGKEDLSPSQGRDGINGGHTVGDFRAGQTRSNVNGESVDFRDNVSNHGKLSDASVLQFSSAVLVERGLVNVLGQTEGIPVARGFNHSELAFVRVERRCGSAQLLRGGCECGARSDQGGKDSELHGDTVRIIVAEISLTTGIDNYGDDGLRSPVQGVGSVVA